MAQLHESVADFLSALTSELEEIFSQAGTEKATVSWTQGTGDASRDGMIWWSCSLSVDPDCRFFAGASAETWDEMTGDRFAIVEQIVQKAAQGKFGAAVLCTDTGAAEEPAGSLTAVTVGISVGERAFPPMEFVLNRELEIALGGTPEEEQALEHQPPDLSSVDRLMHVEIPVSVVLGRTQMRMKDLLNLNHGAIVELDQELSEEVEIRVSNCAIARGEVVAVEGNYGVRILRMLPGRNGTVTQSALTKGDS